MARIDHWQYLVDSQGRPLQNTQVRVYLAGTSTEANIYLDGAVGVLTTSSSEDLKTDENGFFQFWVGDEWETNGGYSATQQFRIVWQNDIDGIEEEIDDLFLYAPVLPIDVSDDIKGIPSNKDKNKVISNRQGYKWDGHVDSIVPSASPHNLQPVVFYDLNTIKNRVISDKLGYQMYEMASTASSISVDVSASSFYTTAVSAWSASGGLYYADVNHNFNNYYPIIKISKVFNDRVIEPELLKSISPNITRIWVTENINFNVTVLG